MSTLTSDRAPNRELFTQIPFNELIYPAVPKSPYDTLDVRQIETMGVGDIDKLKTLKLLLEHDRDVLNERLKTIKAQNTSQSNMLQAFKARREKQFKDFGVIDEATARGLLNSLGVSNTTGTPIVFSSQGQLSSELNKFEKDLLSILNDRTYQKDLDNMNRDIKLMSEVEHETTGRYSFTVDTLSSVNKRLVELGVHI